MLQAELKILGGKHQGKAIPLTTKKFLVGREQDCHLRPNSDMVSRHHCVFSIDDFAVRLRDLGSTNGTRVNGEALRGEVVLKPGDQIGIGKMELELVVRQPAAIVAKVLAKTGSSSEIESVPGGVTAEIPVYLGDSNGEIANAELNETTYEIPAVVGPAAQDTAMTAATDTAIFAGTPPAGYPGGYPQMTQPGYPQMMPQGYPQMMPGYGQPPMGYPQQYPPGYGQPVYPQMPGYPMGMPMQGGMPMAPSYPMPAPAAAEPVSAAAALADVAIRLPPPESTGFKDAPPPAAPAPGGAPAAPVEKPSTSAADIIKNYMQKRTR